MNSMKMICQNAGVKVRASRGRPVRPASPASNLFIRFENAAEKAESVRIIFTSRERAGKPSRLHAAFV